LVEIEQIASGKYLIDPTPCLKEEALQFLWRY